MRMCLPSFWMPRRRGCCDEPVGQPKPLAFATRGDAKMRLQRPASATSWSSSSSLRPPDPQYTPQRNIALSVATNETATATQQAINRLWRRAFQDRRAGVLLPEMVKGRERASRLVRRVQRYTLLVLNSDGTRSHGNDELSVSADHARANNNENSAATPCPSNLPLMFNKRDRVCHALGCLAFPTLQL
jgi:hypothetical protein